MTLVVLWGIGLAVAATLYGLRSHFRLWYGFLELVVGLLILAGAVNAFSAAWARGCIPVVGGGVFCRPAEGWLHWNATWTALFPIAAAIYILVRAMDNISEGLTAWPNSGWTRSWQRLFPRDHKG
jgi:hypothetical protein